MRQDIGLKIVAAASSGLATWPAHAAGMVRSPRAGRLPVDFILFGFTLLGVPVSPNHTLRVGLRASRSSPCIARLHRIQDRRRIPGLLAHLHDEVG